MKTRSYTRLMLGLLVFLPTALLAADPLAELLQKGLYEEEANQNPRAAIEFYQSLVQRTDDQRRLAATAVYRLGECYRKLGQTNEAVAQYQRVVRDYTDQDALLKLSRQNLAALAPATATPPGSLTASTQRQKALLTQELELVQQQLASKRKMLQVGRAGPDDLIPIQREALALQRQIVEVESKSRVDLLDVTLPPATEAANPARAVGAETLSTEEQTEIGKLMEIKRSSPDLLLTPDRLLRAAAAGQLKVIGFLLDNGADVNGGDRRSQAPLRAAALNGHKGVVDLLLARGADPNVHTPNGGTPLHLAAYQGHRAVIGSLLDAKADVNAVDSENRVDGVYYSIAPNWTPLHAAASRGLAEVVRTLLEAGAKIDPRDANGDTPLTLAATAGSEEIVSLLLKQGANVRNQDRDGLTVLFHAIRLNQPGLLKVLLAAGADARVTDVKKRTPLHWTILGTGGRWEVPGSPLTGRPETADRDAIADILHQLLAAGTEVNAPDQRGNTPVHLAVARNAPELLRVLLERKPDLEVKNATGQTPLLVAMGDASGNLAVGTLLLEAGANPDASYNDHTPLHFTAAGGWADWVALLLKHRANPNALNKQNETPLKLALISDGADSAKDRIVTMLRAAGGDPLFHLRDAISLGRPNEDPHAVVHRQGSAVNRFTLLETLALFCSGWMPNDLAMLAFPDLTRVTIRHRAEGRTEAKATVVNVEALVRAGDRQADPWLAWGDIVEIPEAEHPRNESWRGLPEDFVKGLGPMLNRQVELRSKAGVTNLALKARFDGVKLKFDSCWLSEVVPASGLVLNSSDLAQVKVRRSGSTGPSDMVFDLEVAPSRTSVPVAFQPLPVPGGGLRPPAVRMMPSGGSPGAANQPPATLWLRDGDVIEIPEKGR